MILNSFFYLIYLNIIIILVECVQLLFKFKKVAFGGTN